MLDWFQQPRSLALVKIPIDGWFIFIIIRINIAIILFVSGNSSSYSFFLALWRLVVIYVRILRGKTLRKKSSTTRARIRIQLPLKYRFPKTQREVIKQSILNTTGSLRLRLIYLVALISMLNE
jgi:hypothetical protein